MAMSAMMAMSFAACSDDEPEPGPNPEPVLDEQEQALKLVINDYVDKTVIPTYQGMADASIDLYEACLAMRNAGAGNVTEAMVKTACDHWEVARRYWELSEAWLYGPAADYNIDPHIDTWPLDRTAMENLLSNEQQMNNMDEDGVFISTLGESLLGFHAVEYMLYGQDENGIGTGNPRNVNLYTTQELIYLTAVAGDLRNQCIRLEASWAGMDNVTAEKSSILTELELEPTYDYGEMMRNSGTAGSLWVNYLNAVQELIVGAQDISDEVGGLKIGNPTGHGEEDDLQHVALTHGVDGVDGHDAEEHVHHLRRLHALRLQAFGGEIEPFAGVDDVGEHKTDEHGHRGGAEALGGAGPDGVGVVGHAAHQVAYAARFDVRDRQPVELGREVAAHPVSNPLGGRRYQTVLRYRQQEAGTVDEDEQDTQSGDETGIHRQTAEDATRYAVGDPSKVLRADECQNG